MCEGLQENRDFIPTTRGCCPDVDLMAQKALRTVSWRCAPCVVVCAMREVISVEEGHDVEHVTEMREFDMTSASVKLAREMSSTLWRCHRFSTSTELWRIPDVFLKMVFLIFTRGFCVFLKLATFVLCWVPSMNRQP